MKHLMQDEASSTPPLNKIVFRNSDRVAQWIQQRHNTDCESPIEEILFVAVLSEMVLRDEGLH